MEMEEIVKILIFVAVLIVMVGAVILLLKGKGFEVLENVRHMFKFGGN